MGPSETRCSRNSRHSAGSAASSSASSARVSAFAFCLDLLDQDAMRRDSLPADARADYDSIYGVAAKDLDEAGPSVVSINGVVASLAVTEFMVWVTGLRAPQPLMTYRAERGIVGVSMDLPAQGCPYCSRARREAA